MRQHAARESRLSLLREREYGNGWGRELLSVAQKRVVRKMRQGRDLRNVGLNWTGLDWVGFWV